MTEQKEYIPYTYLLGWSNHDMWYYGVEYSLKGKIANPTNLWTIYFTTSKYVQRFVEENGSPDIIEIRKTFPTSKEARKWETKVLKRMGVVKSPRWLNKTDNISIAPECAALANTPKSRINKSLAKLGKPPNNAGKPWSKQNREARSKAYTARDHPKIRNTVTARNIITGEVKRILKEEFYNSSEWIGVAKGNKHTEEFKLAQSARRKGKPFFSTSTVSINS